MNRILIGLLLHITAQAFGQDLVVLLNGDTIKGTIQKTSGSLLVVKDEANIDREIHGVFISKAIQASGRLVPFKGSQFIPHTEWKEDASNGHSQIVKYSIDLEGEADALFPNAIKRSLPLLQDTQYSGTSQIEFIAFSTNAFLVLSDETTLTVITYSIPAELSISYLNGKKYTLHYAKSVGSNLAGALFDEKPGKFTLFFDQGSVTQLPDNVTSDFAIEQNQMVYTTRGKKKRQVKYELVYCDQQIIRYSEFKYEFYYRTKTIKRIN